MDMVPQITKSGGIPIKIEDGKLYICLVTSSTDRKKYIFPKGNLDAGETPMQTAMRESHEEAGISGQVINAPLMFNDDKSFYLADKISIGDFMYYPIWVEKTHKKWEEKHLRKRKWVEANEILERKRYKHLYNAILTLAQAALWPDAQDEKNMREKMDTIRQMLKAYIETHRRRA